MNTTITKIIEQYLENELSPQDKAAFEQRLSENPALRTELERLQQIREASKRAAVRTQVIKTGKRYHLLRKVWITGVVTAILLLSAFAYWQISAKEKSVFEGMNSDQLQQLYARLEKLAPLESLPVTFFNLEASDTVVLSETGVLLSVPEGAFLLDGKPYSGPKIVQWQEAIHAASIVKAGLSTVSGDRLLETQGMFGMQAFTPDGTQLEVNPKVGVYVQVPVDELKEGMQLFEGKRMQNGQIDWQNPQPLEKLPVMALMNELDFYPPGYAGKLDELKWKTGKKERDSLYGSFEEADVQVSKVNIPVKKRTVVYYPYATEEQIKSHQRDKSIWEYNAVEKTATSDDNASWTFNLEKTESSSIVEIVATVRIRKGWFINTITEDGPKDMIPTSFEVNPSIDYEIIGNVTVLEIGDNKYNNPDQFLNCYNGQVQFRQKVRLKVGGSVDITGKYKFQSCSSDKCLEPIEDPFLITVEGRTNEQLLPPSSVLAFWNTKFNNTILATRDFERRMKFIHTYCNRKVMEIYTSQLNKPIWMLDNQVASMGYTEFKEFAKERVGVVELDNNHIHNLSRFYRNTVLSIRRELKRNHNYVRELEKTWDDHIAHLRLNEENRTYYRELKNKKDEFNLNMAKATQQLNTSKRMVGFTIRRGVKSGSKTVKTVICNLDSFVDYVTLNRTTKTFTDASTGKKATITYNRFSLQVEEYKRYEKLFVYLFPHEMNSFQRIDCINGVVDYPLNNGITYDMVVAGINEEDYYLYQKTGFNQGDLGLVSLESLSENAFNSRLETLNAGRQKKPLTITNELEWLLKEQQNYKVQRLRMEREAFRNTLRPIVFPCNCTDSISVVPAQGVEWEPADDEEQQIAM